MGYNMIQVGKNPPADINVIIEIAANAAPIKYEVDKDSGCLLVDRFVATPMFYPANYGYVPHTLCDDGDPLDVLVITPYDIVPGSVINARPIGVLNMADESGEDAKVLAVPSSKLTKIYDDVQDIADVSQALLDKIEHYFSHYKDLEAGKWVKITGWQGVKQAKQAVLDAIALANLKT